MSIDPRQREELEDVAAFWFARRHAGDMTQEDARAFEIWLGAGPANKAAFGKAELAWALLGDIEDDAALIAARDRDEADFDTRKRGRLLAAAAGVALVVGAGWAAWNTTEVSEWDWFAAAPTQEFRTSVGQRTTVTLLDGSTVTLDTDTIVRARLSGNERHIELERGQAYFQVAKDKSRPFIVAAAGKAVRATGTAFDVRVEPGRFEVTLIEGRVQVREEGAKSERAPVADMRQGWRLAVGEDARWRIEPVDLARETTWHDGMLAFYDEPLVQAVAEVNRYSQRKIVFRGSPPNTLVLGRFQTGDVESFVRAVELNKLARVTASSEHEIELAAR